MAYLYRNYSKQNGKTYIGNYSVVVELGNTKKRFALKTKEMKVVKSYLQSIEEKEQLALKYPGLIQEYIDDIYQLIGQKEKSLTYIKKQQAIKKTYLKDTFKAMLKHKQMSDKINSPNTMRIYNDTLRELINAWGNIALEDLSYKDETKFYEHCSRKKYSLTTKNIHKRGLKSFFMWCVKNSVIDKAPFLPEQKKATDYRLKWIKPEEFETILSSTDDVVYKARFRLAYYQGLRRGEFKNLFCDNEQLIVIGKGNKIRELPLMYDLAKDDLKLIKDYPCVDNTYSQCFKTVVDKVGLKYNFHCLRHSFAHNCMTKGISIFHLQHYLGHSSVSTTEGYLKDFGLDYKKYASRTNKY
tara:strand:- start:495 stop:1559 length:1065 start_codon:yes stop_codon:yes gene_type:complete